MGVVNSKTDTEHIFYTHDNGGRPYKVTIHSNGNVIVEKHAGTESEEYVKEFTIRPRKAFVGRSPLNKMTRFSGGYGPRFDGNSILLELRNGEYMFIGHTIFKFKTFNPIVKYVSPVGNNDVPYPYAIDDKGQVYLMLERILLPNPPAAALKEPHFYYYQLQLITPDRGVIPPRQPIIKNFARITDFYIGNQRYTMTYNPNPDKEYDRLIKNFGPLSVRKTDGKKYRLTKKQYRELMTRFGKRIGVESF